MQEASAFQQAVLQSGFLTTSRFPHTCHPRIPHSNTGVMWRWGVRLCLVCLGHSWSQEFWLWLALPQPLTGGHFGLGLLLDVKQVVGTLGSQSRPCLVAKGAPC